MYGTNADNDIKVVGDQALATNFTVSVDGSPAVQYINFPNLVVDGLAGDDEIDIDVFALALTSLTVRGNNPSVDGDTLTVEGLAGADNATWRPTAFDGGSFTVGAQTITVQTMERLIYDGKSEAENLTVVLPAALAGNLAAFEFDTFTFRGSVNVNRDGGQLLGIEFEDISALGTVTIDGATNGAADTLFYGGREVIDQIVVSNAGVITNAPLSIPVRTPGVEDLVLLGRNGNDVFDIASDHPYNSIIVTGDGSDAGATADANGDQVLVRGVARAETITVKPNPYIDSETYITGTGVNQARNISTSGVERIYYLGAADTSGAERHVGRRSGSRHAHGAGGRRAVHGLAGAAPPLMTGPYDRVTSDSLPQVFGSHLDILRVAPAAGAPGNVEVTFVTGDLTQARNYEAVLGGDDTLVIEGSDGLADRHTATRPAVGSVRVVDTNSGVTVTETSGGLGPLADQHLGGDDVGDDRRERDRADHGADHVRRRGEQRSAAGSGDAERRGGERDLPAGPGGDRRPADVGQRGDHDRGHREPGAGDRLGSRHLDGQRDGRGQRDRLSRGGRQRVGVGGRVRDDASSPTRRT